MAIKFYVERTFVGDSGQVTARKVSDLVDTCEDAENDLREYIEDLSGLEDNESVHVVEVEVDRYGNVEYQIGGFLHN